MAVTGVLNKGIAPKIVGGIVRVIGLKSPYPSMTTASIGIAGSGLVPTRQRGLKNPYPQMQPGSTVVATGGFRVSAVKPLPGSGGGGGGGGTIGYGI